MLGGWSLKGQYLNLLIFLGGLATLLGPNIPDTWEALPSAITPKSVIGFLIAASAYARSINTEKPRTSFQERKTDLPQVIETVQDQQDAQAGRRVD